MKLGLEITQQFRTKQQFELTDPEKAALLKAEELWGALPHHAFEVPLPELHAILFPDTEAPPQLEGKNLEREFVMVDPEDLKIIDPEERIGSAIAGCIFVSKETPEAYIPLVVLNLALYANVLDEEALREIYARLDVDDPTASHWTANLFDLSVAEHTFGPNSKDFHDFLRWRRGIERTDFFRNPLMDSAMHNRLDTLKNRRMLPSERSTTVRRSWNLGTLFHKLGSDFERLAPEFRVSKSHLLFLKITEQSTFHAPSMLRLIDLLLHHTDQEMLSSSRRARSISLPEDDPQTQRLATNAYLLTPDIAGDFAIIQNGPQWNKFYLLPHKHASLRSLKDLIHAFFNETIRLTNKKIGHGLIAAVSRARSLSFEVGEKENPLSVSMDNPEDAKNVLGGRRSQIAEKIQKIDDALARFEEICARLQDGRVQLLPGHVQEQIEQLKALRDQLSAQMEQLDPATIDAILAIQSEFANLLGELH